MGLLALPTRGSVLLGQICSHTYPNTQIALSALHLEQGVDPSHLLFFNRHLSHALHTRLRMASVESWETVRRGCIFFAGDNGTGDIVDEL